MSLHEVVLTLDSMSKLKYELSQLYLVAPNMSNTVVDDPYHIVEATTSPGMNIPVRLLDNTDSKLDIRNIVNVVGPGRAIRCHTLDPKPSRPDAR